MVDDNVVAADDSGLEADALFTQFHVDRERLQANIDAVLTDTDQATLADITDAHPLSQGLAEIVAYYQLASESEWTTIDSEAPQQLSWPLPDGSIREATIDRIIFVRPA